MANKSVNESIIELNVDDEENEELEDNRSIIEELCKPFAIPDEILTNLKILLLYEIKRGLCKFTHKNANVKCHPTYIQYLPTGCEKGNFLVLEVYNETCRIILVHIDENSNISNEQELYEISDNHSLTGDDLFNYIADCLANFITSRELAEETLNISFLFSFPIKQVDLNSAYLIKWTNRFLCEDVVDQNVVQLLHEAIKRRNDLHIGTIALCNNMSNNLISCARINPNTKISCSIGQTTNANYIEKVKHITRVQPNARMPPIMILNTEWSSFGDNKVLQCIRNKFDIQLDLNSKHPGKKTYEKMLCHVGELVRLIIIAAIEAGALFKGHLSDQIQQPNILTMYHILNIENDETINFTIQVLEFLGYKNKFSPEDCDNIRYICEQVTTRSSDLLAAGIACLIDRIGDPYIGIAMSGFIYRQSVLYQERLKKKIRQLARPEYDFDLMLCKEEDAIYGAALVAGAVAKKQKIIQNHL